MLDQIAQTINEIVGKDLQQITGWQMALRTVLTYIIAITFVRWGHKRFMGQSTAFDIILGYILGSVLSRGINGQAPFLLTIEASALLIFIHWFLAFLSFKSHFFGRLIKGKLHILGRDGAFDEAELRRHRITKDDAIGSLRKYASQQDVSKFETVVLENSGSITGVLATREPRIVQLPVEDGVKIIRIEID